jgi:PncC family amidohydrolase
MPPAHESLLFQLGAAAGELLKQRQQTLAVAESSAGGLISAALLAVPGASAYFLGGGVIYTVASRIALVGIAAEEVKHMRSASEPYARLLARRVRERLGSTWGLSETGAAGPTGNRYGDAPGHTCIAVSGPVEAAITVETASAEREANMWRFAHKAVELLESCLRQAGK